MTLETKGALKEEAAFWATVLETHLASIERNQKLYEETVGVGP